MASAQTVTVLFFAALAEQLNCRSQQLELPANVQSVDQLREHLSQQGNVWTALRSDQLRCAVNQEIVKMNHLLQAGDEVAFFPPVTGG